MFLIFGFVILYCPVFGAPAPALARPSADLLSLMPLHFEPSGHRWVARTPFYEISLATGAAAVRLPQGASVHLRWLGSQDAVWEPLDRQESVSHDLRGKDPARWRRHVPHYGRMRLRQLWPGVDLVFYGNNGELEHDFLVAPGADPAQIAFQVVGACKLRLQGGDLLVETPSGVLQLRAPVAYQMAAGRRRAVHSRFRLLGQDRVTLLVGRYDRSLPLVIDPVLSFATYLGGYAKDAATAVAVDAQQNIYIAGYTTSFNLPTTGGALSNYTGAGEDIFIAKLSASGKTLLFSTYLGGNGNDRPVGLAVDAAGNITVAVNTTSDDLPRFGQGLQETPGGIFLAKLAADGSRLLASTYFGGDPGLATLAAMTTDSAGVLYLVGTAHDPAFPTTSGVVQPAKSSDRDAFAASVAADLSQLRYATFLGGSGADQAAAVTVDAQGRALVAGLTQSPDFPVTSGAHVTPNRGGADAFLLRLDAAAGKLDFSAILGGSSDDFATAVTLGPQGNPYVAGLTYSLNYPTTAGAFQALRLPLATYGFVNKFTPDGSQPVYSTYLGAVGGYFDVRSISRIIADSADNLLIAGHGLGNAFPITGQALQSLGAGDQDGFLAKLSPAGDLLVYGSYFGGAGEDAIADVAVDAAANVYIAGSTTSTNLPAMEGVQIANAGNTDAFAAKIDLLTSTPACRYALSASALTLDAAGGSGSFEITASAGCPWSATSSQAWLTFTGPTSGTGNGTVSFQVAVNNTTANRTAVISIAGLAFTVTQTAAVCSYRIDPGSRSMPYTGGTINFLVTTLAGCNWTVRSNAAWMRSLVSGSVSGTGQAFILVEQNDTAIPRTGSLSIANQGIHVLQEGPTPVTAFADVPPTHLFAAHIFLLKNNNVADYCNQDPQLYCPEAATTRAQMALLLTRALQGGDVFPYPSQPYFTDVPPQHPQFPYIQKLRELGITVGCTPTQFCPEENVSRAQMAVFLVRAKLRIRAGQAFSYPQTPYFSDVLSTDPYFPFIQKMKELGITSGCSAGEYCPGGPATRGQMAVFVVRALLTP